MSRTLVIEARGLLHHALKAASHKNHWYVFCANVNYVRHTYYNDDLQDASPTCVRCLAMELTHGGALKIVYPE